MVYRTLFWFLVGGNRLQKSIQKLEKKHQRAIHFNYDGLCLPNISTRKIIFHDKFMARAIFSFKSPFAEYQSYMNDSNSIQH